MNPRRGHFRRPRAGRRLPGTRRTILRLAAAAVFALSAPAEAQPAPGATYGPVRPAETLSQLASRFRGEASVNARQAMIAILRANPDAFVDGNINALRAGVTLRVPTRAEMEAITPGEAAAEFARHDQAWRNRRRTGSAAPGGPAPQAAPAPSASPPAAEGTPEDAADAADASEELRKARETVSDLRERIAERDEAIEDLLVQLAAVQRELRQLRAEAEPAPSGGSGAPERGEREAAGGAEGAASAGSAAASAPSWLPVSPLVLGSSLIVLLVLVVVVTLLRQRGEAEEVLPEEPFEEEEGEEAGEDPGDEETLDGEPRAQEGEPDPEDGGAARDAPEEDGPGAERRAPASSRTGAGLASAIEPEGGAAAEGVEAAEVLDEGGEGEAADLPIGIDLDEEEPWDEALDGPAPDGAEPGPRTPGGLPELGPRIELDDLDVDPATSPRQEVSIDLGEGDDLPEGGPAHDRRERGRQE